MLHIARPKTHTYLWGKQSQLQTWHTSGQASLPGKQTDLPIH